VPAALRPRGGGASKPNARACSTAWVRLCAELAVNVPLVGREGVYSSPAISRADRLARSKCRVWVSPCVIAPRWRASVAPARPGRSAASGSESVSRPIVPQHERRRHPVGVRDGEKGRERGRRQFSRRRLTDRRGHVAACRRAWRMRRRARRSSSRSGVLSGCMFSHLPSVLALARLFSAAHGPA
jgi:hypothetical protein